MAARALKVWPLPHFVSEVFSSLALPLVEEDAFGCIVERPVRLFPALLKAEEGYQKVISRRYDAYQGQEYLWPTVSICCWRWCVGSDIVAKEKLAQGQVQWSRHISFREEIVI